MNDHPTPTAHDPGTQHAATLRELSAAYPDLDIRSEHWGGITPVWVAHGSNGHPWLVASDDVARFRRALDGERETG